MKRLPLLLLGLLFLLSFALFSRFVKQGSMKETDFAVTVKVQERIDNSSRLRLARLTGETMEGVTFLASPMVSSVLILAVTMILLITRRKQRLVVLLIPLAFGLMTLIEIYGKSVVHHPAPPFFLLKNPTTIFPKYYVWEDYSYPSGHAARAIFLAIVVSRITYHVSRKRKDLKKEILIASILAIYVGLVSVSRIYLGQHWLSDVIGGGLLGTSLASFTMLL